MVQSNLVNRLRAIGAFACKLNASWIGFPDLLVIHRGKFWLVEVKRDGQKPRAAQLKMHAILRSHGAAIAIVDKARMAAFIAEVENC